MSTFAKKIGNSLRKFPFVFKYSSKIYKNYIFLTIAAKDYYLKLIEFFLPRNFYLQTIPDFIKNTHNDIKKSYKEYNFKQHRNKRDSNRIINSKYFLDIVYKLPEGDYAEVGTYKGIFAKFIFRNVNPHSELFCFDTFEGFAEHDVKKEKEQSKLSVPIGFFSDTSIEKVKKNILGKDATNDHLHLIKGYFPDSFKGFENHKWRFVLLDADLYEPMKYGAEKFWPGLVKGGILMIHDYYGAYIGTKRAIDEYFNPLGIYPVPLCDEGGTAIIIKQ